MPFPSEQSSSKQTHQESSYPSVTSMAELIELSAFATSIKGVSETSKKEKTIKTAERILFARVSCLKALSYSSRGGFQIFLALHVRLQRSIQWPLKRIYKSKG